MEIAGKLSMLLYASYRGSYAIVERAGDEDSPHEHANSLSLSLAPDLICKLSSTNLQFSVNMVTNS
jgi:hypothetical protein